MSINGKEEIEEKKGLKGGKISWIAIIVLIVILSNMVTYILATKFPVGDSAVISKEEYNDLMQFSKLFTVKDNIERFYDGEINQDVLVDGAIKGMTSSLEDPYTVYMNNEDYKTFVEGVEGKYEGIGLQVKAEDNIIVIVTVFEDSPASKAGVIAGDTIVNVAGTDVTGDELDKAVSLMRGEKGTEVEVTFNRKSTGPYTVKIKRDAIKIDTVTSEMIDDSIGLIRISVFENETSKEFEEHLKNLEAQGMKGLVLDLRGNPGGWLHECVNVVSNFVPKDDLIVSTIDKYEKKEIENSKGGLAIGMPLVVLIDGGSASASEIFAGAVRDYKIATLIGEKSFGKGIVQSVLDKNIYGFGDGTALKVTTSKYYTPNGENIHKIGIAPDIEVVYPDELRTQEYDRSKDPQFQKAVDVMKDKLK
ncbi:S41 family peptidase [Clostridium grantii]|uniref:C-terminal processing peptidase-3. Serine peptidase. MEROPS family S41A n=1 Tax=Clostridium grantii DSM 8605 TaxID=1121316 RepID=A0A1M5U5T1_9CLOT|nr:S41 family peptidase [Clostridium grantii]SHH58063.1 C-terminal processing peptidase-3. Serine peptidase. MEROPS family S41A [Clostridium grantii DSM 8605]